MENFALTIALSDAQKEGLKAMLLKTIEEVTGDAEDMIVEYVMVMVENGRTMSSMSEELSTFIPPEHAAELIKRLYGYLSAQITSQQADTTNAPAASASKTATEAKKDDSSATAAKTSPQSKIVNLKSSSAATKEVLEKPLSSRREGVASTAKAIQPPSKKAEQKQENESKRHSTRLLTNAMQASLKSTREQISAKKGNTEQKKQTHQQQKNHLNSRDNRGQRQVTTGNKRNPQQQQQRRDIQVDADMSRTNKRRKEVDQYEIELSDNEMHGQHGQFMQSPGGMPMNMMDPSMYYQQMEEYANMMGFSSADEYMEAYQQQMMGMVGGGMAPFGHAPRGRGMSGGRSGRGRGRGRGRGPSRAPGPTTAGGRNMSWVREADMESSLSARR